MSRTVSLVIALALLMETIDSTILATALPQIAADMNAPVLSLKLALSTYLIALAAFVPASGWIADRYGAKRVFIAAMLVFMVGSVLCAMQAALPGLILSRAIQGMGGAMMVPVGRLIVLKGAPKSEMVAALAYLTVPALIGPAIGPLLGAVLTQAMGWQAIFLVNIPLGIIAIVLALRLVPNILEQHVEPIDLVGMVLSVLGVSTFMFGVSAAGGHVIPASFSWVLSVSGLVIMVVYFRHTRRRDDALLDTRLFRLRTFLVGVVGGGLFRTSGGAASFLLPLLFQLGFGLSILASGMLSACYALGGMTMRMLAPRVIDAFGFRATLLVGGMASCALTSAFALQSALIYYQLVPLLIAAGLAQALVFTAVNGIVFADIDEERMSHATSLSAVSQQVAMSLGIAVAAFVLQLGGNPSASAAPRLADFAPTFIVIAVLSATSLLLFIRLRRSDGSQLRHREHLVRHHWY